MRCMRCRQFLCLDCVQELSRQLDRRKDQADTPYSMALHQLLDAKLPEGQPSSSSIILSIPGSMSHCCELKVRALAEKKSDIAIERVKTLSSLFSLGWASICALGSVSKLVNIPLVRADGNPVS